MRSATTPMVCFVAALTAGGCGGESPARPHAAAPTGGPEAQVQPAEGRATSPAANADISAAPREKALVGAPAKPRRAALRFDIEGRSFPSPLVDALIAGQPATLIVDTGATHHVVARWLAEELSVPLKNGGDAATDHAGHAVNVARIEDASFSMAGWGSVPVPTLLVVPVPEVLHQMGIGGVLSPQALASEGRAVILDLRAGAMTEAPVDEALRRLDAVPSGATITSVRVCGGNPIQGTQLAVPVTIEGIAAEVKLDSGASHSSLFGGRGAGQRLAGRAGKKSRGYAASGGYVVPTIEGARIQLGSLEAHADVDILPNAPPNTCARDGYIGMDVLRACVLVLAGSRSALRCAP